MGTSQRTPEHDYRQYARPEPDGGGTWVEVIDDGGGSAGHGGEPAAGIPSPEHPQGAFLQQPPGFGPGTGPRGGPGRRFNPYLWAAWAVVAVMLAIGAGWFFGMFAPSWETQPVEVYPPDSSVSGTTQRMSAELETNLYVLGPFLCVLGPLWAVTLLTVQAVLFRRVHPAG